MFKLFSFPNFYTAILALVLFNLSCKRNPNSQITNYFASNGKIESIRHFINDTIETGVSKYFYENGIIKDSIEYKNNKKNGFEYQYYDTGVLKSKMYFKDGLLEEKSYSYFPNGNIESEKFWIKDKLYGNTFFYYPNNILELYNCNDFYGTNIYVLNYDSIGNKIKEEGQVFSRNLKTNFDNSRKVKVNDTLNVQITVSEPPKTKTLIEISFNKLNTKPVYKKYEIINNTIIFSKKINDSGVYSFFIRGFLLGESENNILLTDSLHYEIEIE